ncbi:MAG: hypothetical protein JXA41_02445 [Deltaproteobacteria bacterium]|nr:hypothetical protein [Deltaproteobacteria bacterium]
MIAMSILAIALVAVFQSQSQSLSMKNDARFATTAALLAQGKMAELEAASARDLMSGRGDFGELFPDYIWEVVVGESAVQDLKRIELVVVHNKMPVNNTYQIVFYKYSAI